MIDSITFFGCALTLPRRRFGALVHCYMTCSASWVEGCIPTPLMLHTPCDFLGQWKVSQRALPLTPAAVQTYSASRVLVYFLAAKRWYIPLVTAPWAWVLNKMCRVELQANCIKCIKDHSLRKISLNLRMKKRPSHDLKRHRDVWQCFKWVPPKGRYRH